MLKGLKKVGNSLMNSVVKHKKLMAFAIVAVAVVVTSASAQAADLLTIDATSGMPVFDASVVFTPLITVIVSIVTAAVALWVSMAGIGFIKRFMHG